MRITPFLPLPHKRSPDGAKLTVVADMWLQLTTLLSTPKGRKAESA